METVTFVRDIFLRNIYRTIYMGQNQSMHITPRCKILLSSWELLSWPRN